MSRIGCGKAVEEAAATKRGVWLAPVEGSSRVGRTIVVLFIWRSADGTPRGS